MPISVLGAGGTVMGKAGRVSAIEELVSLVMEERGTMNMKINKQGNTGPGRKQNRSVCFRVLGVGGGEYT